MSATQPYIPRRTDNRVGGRPRHRSFWNELRVWWREVDRVLLGLVLVLMLIGTVAVSAGSPATAARLSTADEALDPLYFYWAHLRWTAIGVMAMLGLSFLQREDARRIGILLAFAMVVLMIPVIIPGIGHEVNGARRWLKFGLTLQPSEFLKPGFAILLAWILSWRIRDPDLPVAWATGAVMALVGALLMLQPNFGDTMLFGGVWFTLILLSGVAMKKIAGIIVGGLSGVTLTYFFYDNARNRIDSFFAGGTAYDQVDLAQRTLLSGGWTGTGYGLGIRKMRLPEAHTDYIFSVVGEEFGLLACAVIVALFLAIVVRVLVRLADEENLFALLAGAGLTAQLGGQAFINMLVNLQLFPSKGMTLPLVSYGGSSTVATCVTVGLLLAITRRNPFLTRETPGLKVLLGTKAEKEGSPR
ncbi:putative peptidoglycan glycosyltransferase FtsW [Qipengyuania sp. JC766]|uniref:peptidoglycan glycosyltransferase FtsW n=1 Tax=Qipengyuania sp. JC766 TaxID=3232139 RepID=UPI00345845F0